MNVKQSAYGAIIALGALLSGCSSTASISGPDSATGMPRTGPLSADAKREIDDGYRSTLNRLYESTPGSRELVAKARGVLVFPRVIAAGLVVGGQYGEGELRVAGAVSGYYRTTTGSVGWQIGAQSKSLVFLFMTQDALDKFRSGSGWAGAVDASVAVLKLGANGEIQANADKEPMIAFVLTNSGLMANLTLEGTKVTKIE